MNNHTILLDIRRDIRAVQEGNGAICQLAPTHQWQHTTDCSV